MTLKAILAGVVASVAMAVAGAAWAQLNTPIPTNAYIAFGGLDWAWGAPIADPSGSFLGYQGAQGWRLPTSQELEQAPNAVNFLFTGANAPFEGTDPLSGANFVYTDANYANAKSAGACATPYFGIGYLHCDFGDGNGELTGPWAGTVGNQGNADQLYVRGLGPGVPEPATWTSLIVGFAAIGAMLRRRTRKVLA